MRKYILLICLLFLTGCGEANNTKTTNDYEQKNIENIAQSSDENDQFMLELISEKTQFKQGESLNIVAKLTNKGEAVVLGHGGSWLFLNTTNLTKNYQFGSAMNEPYIMTEIAAEQTIEEVYGFSGATYDSSFPGEPYTDSIFHSMANMEFPVGQYEIEAITAFHLHGIENSEQRLKAKIIFEVVD
jgi:hypothetical protein